MRPHNNYTKGKIMENTSELSEENLGLQNTEGDTGLGTFTLDEERLISTKRDGNQRKTKRNKAQGRAAAY